MIKVKFEVESDSAPVENAEISFFYPNGTYVVAKTDSYGNAHFNLEDANLGDFLVYYPNGDKSHGIAWSMNKNITLFCAKEGYEAYLSRGTELLQAQRIVLRELNSGGSIICNSTCHIPKFSGRLNPKLDSSKRTYLYADNIAINGGVAKPYNFKIDEQLILQDALGAAIFLNVKAMIASSSLLEYQSVPKDFEMPKSNPSTAFPVTDSETNQLIRLGHNNPPADEALAALEETIRSIEVRNEDIGNRDELLAPMKDAEQSIKDRWTSNGILQSAVKALEKAYQIFMKMVKAVDVVSKITNAIQKITDFIKYLDVF